VTSLEPAVLRSDTAVGYLPMAFNDLKAEDGELYRDIEQIWPGLSIN